MRLSNLERGEREVLDFRDQDLDDFKTDKEMQDAILMGLRYKEAYEKLLWEKNVLISCICSGRTDVIGITTRETENDRTTYHVRVKSLDGEQEATWGIDDGKIVKGYACYSPYASVQWMLSEMKK